MSKAIYNLLPFDYLKSIGRTKVLEGFHYLNENTIREILSEIARKGPFTIKEKTMTRAPRNGKMIKTFTLKSINTFNGLRLWQFEEIPRNWIVKIK